jgi:hypothetical protein
MRTYILPAITTLLLLLAALAAAIPIGQQQALNTALYGESQSNQLIADIVNGALATAQLDYYTVQKQLDDLGIYLHALTDSTCVSSGPGPNVTQATGEDAVIDALRSLQLDLQVLELGIMDSDQGAAVGAYYAAQGALERTYDFIFT